MAKQRVGSLTVVFESTPDNLVRTENFIIQALLNAPSGLRNSALAMAYFNEAGQRQRMVVFGNPTDEMKKLMDTELGEEAEAS